MNCGIIIYELEDYVYKLLKFRLSTLLPDSYIIRGTSTDLNSDSLPFAENIHILYDSNQFAMAQICKFSEKLKNSVSISSIFRDDLDGPDIIDCAHLYNRITSTDYSMNRIAQSTDNNIPSSKPGKVSVLLPFSYIDERELFISNHLSYLKDTSMCLRLDLMSGIRMPYSFSGIDRSNCSITQLLSLAKNGRLTPEDILAFCTPDNSGFLVTSKPYHSDDIFDCGIEVIEKVLVTAKMLTKDTSYPMNILVVAEGFKIADLSRIASFGDEVNILLPKRLHQNDLGFKEEIGRITRVLPPQIQVKIHDTEELKTEKNYETMQI